MDDPYPPTAPTHPGGTFALQPRAGGGIMTVAAALARKLTVLAARPERWAVILEPADNPGHCYTQTLVDREAGAWVEAASNEFIEPDRHPREAQCRLLGLFGFRPPDGVVPNHFLIIDAPVDWARVAWLLVGTLEDVYGIDPDEELSVPIFEVGCPSSEPRDDEEGARA